MNENETTQAVAGKNPVAGALGKLGGFIAGHKLIAVAALLVLAGGGFAAYKLTGTPTSGGSFSFIRTVTLERSHLRESVTATGTVKSNGVSKVTIENNIRGYKVKTVNVKVGDVVSEGDVILTMDTADLQSDIAKEQEKISSNQESLLKSYNTAVDNQAQAQTAYDQAVADQQKAWETYDEAYSKYTRYESDMNSAWNKCGSLSDRVNELERIMNEKLSAYNSALGTHNGTYGDNSLGSEAAAPKARNDFLPNPAPDGIATPVTEGETVTAFTYIDKNGHTQTIMVSGYADEADARLVAEGEAAQAVTDANMDADSRFDSYQTSWNNLHAAYTAYADAESAYKPAKADLQSAMSNSGYTEARNNYDSWKQKMESAATAHTNAQRNTENRLTALNTAQKNVQDALKKYQEGNTSDNLKTLQENLAKCVVTAPAAGTVTAISATVGSMISDSTAVATIQETENLLVAITLEEYDVKNVSVGMACEITSDATEGTIPGVVSTISPTSNSSGTFDAEVQVLGGANGLLIGMNAQAEIIQNDVADVYTVPFDAVGTEKDGSRYILVRTQGTGVDAIFDKVPVTVGDGNDYYISIEGAQLKEGMVVRATADLSIGAETTDDASATEAAGDMMGGMMGGMMGRGERNERPDRSPGGMQP